MSTELVRYDAMCHAIDAAYEVDEVKDIRDKASALEHYARQAHNVENERRACEIRLRAERKAGELLRQAEKAQGKRNDLVGRTDQVDDRRTLSDLGITRDQSSQWQRLAGVPQPEFEAALAGPDKPTTTGIINGAAPAKVQPVSDEALWLWGRLKDFERDGLLDRNPNEVCSTMLDHMKITVRELAPRVVAWLKEIDV